MAIFGPLPADLGWLENKNTHQFVQISTKIKLIFGVKIKLCTTLVTEPPKMDTIFMHNKSKTKSAKFQRLQFYRDIVENI